MEKLYYAYVLESMVESFEKEMDKRKDKIKIIYSCSSIWENGDPVTYYLLQAEEGVINPKWELIKNSIVASS